MKCQRFFISLFSLLLLWALLLTGCGMNETEIGEDSIESVFWNPIQGVSNSSKKFKIANRIQIRRPTIMVKPNIPVFEPYTTISANDLVVINNASYTDVSFINGGETLDTYPGKYRTTVEARDNYGNTKSVDVEFTIREPEGYLDPKPEAAARIMQDTSMPDAYKDFLLNGASARITSDVDFEDMFYCHMDEPPGTGDTVTLEDMYHVVFDYNEPLYRFYGVTYGLMNCGKKGTPVLAVRYTIWSFGTWTEDITITLAIHDDELVMTGITETYGRSLDAYYQDGCYFDSIFSNASSAYFDYYVIDGSGLFHSIYSFDGDFRSDIVILNYTVGEEAYYAFHIFDEDEKSEAELADIYDWKATYGDDIDYHDIEEISDISTSYIKGLGLPDYYSYHTTGECMIHAHTATIFNDMLGGYIPSHTSDDELQWQDLIVLEENYYR